MTGNQSKANISVDLELSSFVYIGRGNRSSTKVSVSDSGSIRALAGNLNGNLPYLEISGDGDYPCETVINRNLRGQFECTN